MFRSSQLVSLLMIIGGFGFQSWYTVVAERGAADLRDDLEKQIREVSAGTAETESALQDRILELENSLLRIENRLDSE